MSEAKKAFPTFHTPNDPVLMWGNRNPESVVHTPPLELASPRGHGSCNKALQISEGTAFKFLQDVMSVRKDKNSSRKAPYT